MLKLVKANLFQGDEIQYHTHKEQPIVIEQINPKIDFHSIFCHPGLFKTKKNFLKWSSKIGMLTPSSNEIKLINGKLTCENFVDLRNICTRGRAQPCGLLFEGFEIGNQSFTIFLEDKSFASILRTNVTFKKGQMMREKGVVGPIPWAPPQATTLNN